MKPSHLVMKLDEKGAGSIVLNGQEIFIKSISYSGRVGELTTVTIEIDATVELDDANIHRVEIKRTIAGFYKPETNGVQDEPNHDIDWSLYRG